MTATALEDEIEADEYEVEPDDWPFSNIPDWVTLAPISDLAYRLFGILRAHTGGSSNRSFPGQPRLMAIVGLSSRDPIRDALAELRDIGAVTWRMKATPRGRKTIYKTHYTPHPSASYAGPRRTSDLTAAVIEDMRATRRRRKPRARSTGKVAAQRETPEQQHAEPVPAPVVPPSPPTQSGAVPPAPASPPPAAPRGEPQTGWFSPPAWPPRPEPNSPQESFRGTTQPYSGLWEPDEWG